MEQCVKESRLVRQMPAYLMGASAVLGFSGYLLWRDIGATSNAAAAFQVALDGFFFTFRLFAGVAPETISHDNPMAAIYLNIARFTAPISLILAFLARFSVLWKPLYIRFRVRRFRDFDILFGDSALSRELARQNAAEGRWSVIVDLSDTAHSPYTLHRRQRLIVLQQEVFEADFEDDNLAPKAVVFASEDDYQNILNDSASLGQAIAATTRFVHIASEELRLDLVAAGGVGTSGAQGAAQVFSIHELAARHFAHSHDIVMDAIARNQRRLHVVCVGFGEDTAALVYHLIKVMPCPALGPIRMTILCRGADGVEQRLKVRLGDAPDIAHITCIEIPAKAVASTLLSVLPSDDPISFWYLSSDLDFDQRHFALQLRNAALRDAIGVAPIYLPVAEPFRLWVEAVGPHKSMPVKCLTESGKILSSAFFAGRIDALARALHGAYTDYRQDGAANAHDVAHSLREWRQLDENLRAANRRAADATKTRLELLGLGGPMETYLEKGTGPLSPDPAVLEDLARAEHLSWMADRLVSGWRYAETRDNIRRLHPNLVPYDALSEHARDLDRKQITASLALLQTGLPR
jgi:hypothetical protein